jgi:hypothetical protein
VIMVSFHFTIFSLYIFLTHCSSLSIFLSFSTFLKFEKILHLRSCIPFTISQIYSFPSFFPYSSSPIYIFALSSFLSLI